jgi:hypothetical protein
MPSTKYQASKETSNSARARSRPQSLTSSWAPLRRPTIHLAAVASGGAPADASAFQQHDLQATLCRMQRRGQTGASATDHHQIGVHLAGQRCVPRRRIGRRHIVGAFDVETRIESHDHTLGKR